MTAVATPRLTRSQVAEAADTLLLGLLTAGRDGGDDSAGRLYAIVSDLAGIAGPNEYADAIALLSKVARKRGWIK